MRRGSQIEEVPVDDNALHVDDSVIRKASVAVQNFADLSSEAKGATQKEHAMSFMQAIKLYPKAVAWSILLSTAIVMEGYDVVLLGSFYALPQFNKKYGVMQSDGTYTIPAPWKSGLSNGAQVGEILGLFVNGWVSEKYGYRKTMIASLSLMIGFIFIPFFSHNIQTLLVAGKIRYTSSPVLSLTPSRNSLWYPLGCLPNSYYGLRLRSLPCRSSCLPLHICQSLLGHRSIYRLRCSPWCS
jgi:SP family general alpha glucoside:H+ symporter-like MFS transporter